MSNLAPEARTAVPLGVKRCSKCNEPRTREEFYANAKTSDKLSSWCKPCYKAKYADEREARLARKKVLRAADPTATRVADRAASIRYRAKHRDRLTAVKYGISAEQYAEMVVRSKGRCESCGEAPTKQGLCVDHDHVTGAVRGLLCSKCNAGLGQFNDDPARLRAAVAYLEKHQTDGSSPSGSPRECLETQAVVQVYSTQREGD